MAPQPHPKKLRRAATIQCYTSDEVKNSAVRRAAEQSRTVSNYIEQLIMADVKMASDPVRMARAEQKIRNLLGDL
jgi:hypothetical protein